MCISESELSKNVCNYVTQDGQWSWSSFENLLPVYTLLQIASIKPPLLMMVPHNVTGDPQAMEPSRLDLLMNSYIMKNGIKMMTNGSWLGNGGEPREFALSFA